VTDLSDYTKIVAVLRNKQVFQTYIYQSQTRWTIEHTYTHGRNFVVKCGGQLGVKPI